MRTAAVRVSLIACIVVAVVAVAGQALAADAPSLRRIVVFQEGTPWQVQQQTIAQSGSRLHHKLSLINGVSIQLPKVGTDSALAYLRAHPAVAGVYDDPAVRAHGVSANGAGGDGAGGDGAGGDGAGGDGAGGDGAGGDGAGGDGAGGDQVVFVTPIAEPTVEIYPWGIDRIGAADVQEGKPSVTGSGVKVAVFDTGIDRNHPELAPSIVGGLNAIAGQDPRAYDDDNGHGTAMAGIIAAGINRRGVVGAAPHVKLFAVKVLDRNGQGLTSDGIYALGVIVERQDIRVINMSYGTSLVWPLFKTAIERAVKLGKIIVTSRGNGCTAGAGAVANGAGGDGAGGDGAGGDGAGGDGSGGDGAGGDGAGGDGAGGDGAGGDAGCKFAQKYPAAYPEVITVGATNSQNLVPSYSLLGGIDVVAPGGDSSRKIVTTNRGGGYGEIFGTSPAAAHVTGAVALALQVRGDLSPAAIQALLQQTARPLSCCSVDQQGAGLIDAEALIQLLKSSSTN